MGEGRGEGEMQVDAPPLPALSHEGRGFCPLSDKGKGSALLAG
jgi:hypothetical protein